MRTATKAVRPTRERLIRAGVELFQARGYHGTGLNDVLDVAQTPKGSFYHHFPGGKEQLAVETLGWLQAEVTRFLDELAAQHAGAAIMVEGIARYAAEGIRRGRQARGSLAAVLAQDAAGDSPAVASAVQRYASAIRDRLAAAMALERPEQAAAVFADQALAMIQGAAVIARMEGRAERAVEIVEQWLATTVFPAERA